MRRGRPPGAKNNHPRSDIGCNRERYNSTNRPSKQHIAAIKATDAEAQAQPKRRELRGRMRLAAIPKDKACPTCSVRVGDTRAWVCFWNVYSARSFAVCKACWQDWGILVDLDALRHEFEYNPTITITIPQCEGWGKGGKLIPDQLCRYCLWCSIQRSRNGS